VTWTIRPAEAGDIPALTALYNHYIATTAITFDIEPMTVEARTGWFSHYSPAGRHRLLVAYEGPTLLGYASTSPFAVKAAYETSVEVSVYVAADQARRGIGTALYGALFDSVADEDTPVGFYREVGRKFDRYHDVLRMQREL
jgi:phosphinothricin acetyltransferase